MMDAPYLTLRTALAANRLGDFVSQEQARASSCPVDLILSAPWHSFWCNSAHAEPTPTRAQQRLWLVNQRFQTPISETSAEFGQRIRTMRSLIARRKHVDLIQAITAFYDPNTPTRDAVALWRKALRRADKDAKDVLLSMARQAREKKTEENS